MKRILLIIVFCIMEITCFAQESSVKEFIYKETDIINLADNNANINNIVPNFNFVDLINNLQEGNSISKPEKIVHAIFEIFAEEVFLNIHIMLTIIVLSLIWGIITNIQSSYNSKAVSETAFFAFFAVFLGLIIKGMYECIQLALNVISDQVLFIKSSVPVYIALVMNTGNPTAAGMEPIFLYFIQFMSTILEKLVLPLIFWIAILNMVNCLTDKFSIKRLIESIKQIIKWGIGIFMTLFIGILGISGLTGYVTNGLGMKTLKFAIGSFVPIVGGLLSESISAVIASTVILKNALGLAGVITIILMCVGPLIKMMVLILIYKIATGIIEPISDKRITSMINEAGETITFVFLILITITVMFILGITIVINAGNKII